jgi:hypothetical protein
MQEIPDVVEYHRHLLLEKYGSPCSFLRIATATSEHNIFKKAILKVTGINIPVTIASLVNFFKLTVTNPTVSHLS